MNKELIEKLSAIREDLLAFKAHVTDVEKLVELIKRNTCWDAGSSFDRQSYEENLGPLWRDYQELRPYMTVEQRTTAYNGIGAFRSRARLYQISSSPERREELKINLTLFVKEFVPRMLADLDDIAEKVKAG
jgi:hypothetical protein